MSHGERYQARARNHWGSHWGAQQPNKVPVGWRAVATSEKCRMGRLVGGGSDSIGEATLVGYCRQKDIAYAVRGMVAVAECCACCWALTGTNPPTVCQVVTRRMLSALAYVTQLEADREHHQHSDHARGPCHVDWLPGCVNLASALARSTITAPLNQAPHHVVETYPTMLTGNWGAENAW